MTQVLGRVGGIAIRLMRDLKRAAVTATPRRTVGNVHVPAPLVAAVQEIRGWAHRADDPLVAVFVSVNGAIVGSAELIAAPDDLAARRPEMAPQARSEWQALIDLRGFAGREVRLGGLAVFATGLAVELTRRKVAIRAPELGEVTYPRPGSVVRRGSLHITGWARPPRGLARIEVRVNGTDCGRARAMIPLAQSLPELGGGTTQIVSLDGFEHTVRADNSPVRIEVEGVDRAGERFTIRGAEANVDASEDVDAPWLDQHRIDVLASRVAALRKPEASDRTEVRLVAFTHRLDLGGGQLYLSELLRQLLGAADLSCLVVSAADGPLRDQLEDQGATVHITDFPFRSAEAYETKMLELAHLVLMRGCNVAMINTAVAGIGADLAVRLGIPGVWAIHESVTPDEQWPSPHYVTEAIPYVAGRLRRALGDSTAVAFEAEATRQLYLATAADPRRFLHIPYGVPVSSIEAYRHEHDRAEARAAAGIDPSTTVVLCVGTFEPRKAQAALVVAFSWIADSFPGTQLVLVGLIEGVYSSAVRDLVSSLGLVNRVRLEPVTDDVYAWYLVADIFVLASDVESMPRTLLEAMAFELPVLATKAFGITELIEEDRTGLLIETRDTVAIERGLTRLLAMPSTERAALGRAAGAAIRARFDSAGYAMALNDLLRGLVRDHRVHPADVLARGSSSP